MDLNLHGRHALVCGASEGIGYLIYAMNFQLDPQLIDLRDRVAAFVRDEVVPAESKPFSSELVADLRAKARRAGIFGPQLPREYGGLGLGTIAMCVLFEQAGRSFLGPNCRLCTVPAWTIERKGL